MSPIGRVFAVLNVGFAFMFLYHAGVYMQRDAYWKKEYQAQEIQLKEQLSALRSRTETLTEERDAANLQKDTFERSLNDAEARVTALTSERDGLRKSTTNLEADLSGMRSTLAQINSTLEENTSKTERWQQQFQAAERARDVALAAQSAAENEARQAQNTISELNSQVSSRQGRVDQLTSQLNVAELKIQAMVRKNPGISVDATPPMFGTVVRVDAEGRLLTIVVSDKGEADEILAGYQFAIYKGSTYKGEATVTGVDGNFAFCRMTTVVPGQRAAIDDQATSKF